MKVQFSGMMQGFQCQCIFCFCLVNFEEQIVAVTRAQSQINSVQQLSQKNACFGAVGDSVWNHVMANLRATQVLGAPPPCDGSNMDSAVRFFGDMCAPYDKRNFTDTESTYIKSQKKVLDSIHCVWTGLKWKIKIVEKNIELMAQNNVVACCRLFMCCDSDILHKIFLFFMLSDNKYRKLCTLCGGQNCPDSPGQMAVQNDALNCLLQNERADVAFLSAPVLAESLKANTFGEPHL